MEQKYHKNLQSAIEVEEKTRRAEQEDRMKDCVVTMMEDHNRALRGAEEYYSTVQKKLLVDQKALKVRAIRANTCVCSVTSPKTFLKLGMFVGGA